jgi:GNAT superfamily N-acetyltransferase
MVMGSAVGSGQHQKQFLKWEGPLDSFTAAMPDDWPPYFQQCIAESRDAMELFVITEKDRIVAGGMVFEGLPADMQVFDDDVRLYIEKGYLYIGYLFVDQAHRGKQLGSLWLTCIKGLYGGKGFWLTVEEPGLREFYEKNGFTWVKSLEKEGDSEELLLREPD